MHISLQKTQPMPLVTYRPHGRMFLQLKMLRMLQSSTCKRWKQR